MKFDLDTQRTVICLSGLVGLFCQLLAYSFFQVSPAQVLTGAFVSMAAGPIGLSAIEKFSSRRQGPPDDPPPPKRDRRDRDNIEFMVAAA